VEQDRSASDEGLDVGRALIDVSGEPCFNLGEQLALAASPLEKRTRHDSEFGAGVFDLSNGGAMKVKIRVFLAAYRAQ
jgi:hypothetical protein